MNTNNNLKLVIDNTRDIQKESNIDNVRYKTKDYLQEILKGEPVPIFLRDQAI